MSQYTRREFFRTGSAGLCCAAGLLRTEALWALPLGLPLGLQLYSVREMLPKDYEGTLKQIAAAGYKEVEAAGWFGHSAAQVKAGMNAAGLRCVSAHYPYGTLAPKLEETIAFHKELGAPYIVCASPGRKTAPAAGERSSGELTLEDWRWNAGEFNRIGQVVKAAGMQFGYHNHFHEFIKVDGVVPYDELLRLTDPALVTFEMDCGWVKVGGADPIAYLHDHADRISMLHVKDFKAVPAGSPAGTRPEPAELGRGTMDMGAVLRAATPGKIKHVFVEQEGFDMPPFESLKVDADYMRNLTV